MKKVPPKAGRRSWRRRLLALCLGMVMTFVAGELVTRLVVPAPFIPVFPQIRCELDKLLDFRFIPSQRGYTLDAPATINAMGTRGPEVSDQKPDGALRVLGLGDSFTFGIGVRDDETFCARLQALLNADPSARQVEVVNAGVQGYWTRNEVDWLETRGLSLEPDVVFLQFFYNDIVCIGDWRKKELGVLGKLVRGDREIRMRRPDVWWTNPTWARVRESLKHSRLLFTLKLGFDAVRGSAGGGWLQAMIDGESTPRIEAGWGVIEGELKRAKQLLDPRGVPLLIVVVPLWRQFTEDLPKLRYQSELRAICERLGLPLLDLEPVLRPHFEGLAPIFIPYDGHFNPRGHELVAQALHDWLRERDLPNDRPR